MKIVSTLILFLVTLLCGIVPFRFLRNYLANNKGRADDKIKLLKSFAAGIFLGTCLLHLLPESRHALEEVIGHTEYPVTELTVGLGFLLLFVIENVTLFCQDHERLQDTTVKFIKGKDTAACSSCLSVVDQLNDSNAHLHNGSINRSESVEDESLSNTQGLYKSTNGRDSKNHSQCISVHDGQHSKIQYGSVSDSLTSESDLSTCDGGPCIATLPIVSGLCKRKDYKPLLDNNQIIFGFGEGAEGSDRSALVSVQKLHHNHHHHHHPQHYDMNYKEGHHDHFVKITGLRSIMLLLALSLHTVFDGLVIGLQTTQVLVWTLLAAMSVHKALIAFSLGLAFLESHYEKVKEAMLYLFAFSLVAPVGVGIGTVVTEANFNPDAKSYAAGILQAVATGTFMYVTFMEGLRESFTGRYHLVNVFVVIVGFGCTCALRLAADDD